MADARKTCHDGNKITHTLEPFLDNTNATAHTMYEDEMSDLSAVFSWQDDDTTYARHIAQSKLFPATLNQNADFDLHCSSNRPRLESQSSIVDGLLSEIYDRWHDHKHDSFDSDTFTECSSTSEVMNWRNKTYFHEFEIGGRQIGRLHPALLQEYSTEEVKNLLSVMTRYVNQMSARLVRQLKRRERRMSKVQNNCDIVTAIIQASSPKRRIDTRMRFTVEPSSQGESAFDQWKDAMKAVARLPLGIPDEFRKKVWLSLADQHIHELKIDWDKTVKIAFNERSNPDDNKLGLQIVKDLHRTGCSGFSGEDNEEERALLKRILLAYARWNKTVGYCQGFNVIAALLLEVMDRREADAFKVMIYLIDHVLPQSYFDNNLRALSVDMAVFRDLLKIFPKLSKHLDYLQHAQDQMSGGCYEPPLTNVFTMQWFLTLFATCLPKATTLRVWDAILLDGSEILLRTALVIWGKLSSRILTVSTADEFYTLMGDITQEMLEGKVLDADSMIKSIYSIAPFPFPQLAELREKYTYNIRPFTPANKRNWVDGSVLPSDEDDIEDEDIEAITCFTGFIPVNAATGARPKALEGDQRTGSVPDISSLGPGAYGLGPLEGNGLAANTPAYMERMTTDISALKKQYVKLRQRQRQAHIIQTTASAKQQASIKSRLLIPTIESPQAMNHLFVNKQSAVTRGRNRLVAAGPRIANLYPVTGITSSSQTTVQPNAPQMKCKWVQKSSKQEQRNGNTKSVDCVQSVVETNENNNNNAVIQSKYEQQTDDKSVLQSEEGSVNGRVAAEDFVTDIGWTDETTCVNEHDGSEEKDTIDDRPVISEISPDKDFDQTKLAVNDSVQIEEIDKLTESLNISQNLQHPDEDISQTDSGTEVQYAAAKADTEECSETSDIDITTPDLNGASGLESTSSCSLDKVDETCKDESEASVDKACSSDAGACDCSDKSALGEIGITSELSRTLSEETETILKQIDEAADSTLQSHITDRGPADGLDKTDISLEQTERPIQSEKTSQYAAKRGDNRKLSPSSSASGAHSKSFEQYYHTKRNLATSSSQSVENSQKKFTTSKKSFNPFPVLHMNQNRAKTGIRLGLYKQSTLEEFEKNLKTQAVWGK